MDVLSKGEFAAHIRVTPGRVSQYISAGIIGADALVGEGRGARINVAKAIEQIRARRHVGQALGNGLFTDLAPRDDALPPSRAGALEASRQPDAAELIQLERLEAERRKNRMAAVEEARSFGRLVDRDELERAVGKAAQDVVNLFAGMAPDLANAIAAQFSLPQRDVLHTIRRVMNDKRGAASQAIRAEAEAMPESREAVVE